MASCLNQRLTAHFSPDITGDPPCNDFGLGNIRTIKDFEYISGINLKEKEIIDSEKAFTSNFLSSLSWKSEIFS